MLREWTDRLPDRQAADIWREQKVRVARRRLAQIETELKAGLDAGSIPAAGFYDAMRHFLIVREKMFPGLPADPAWNILVTLACNETAHARECVTGIAYGAGVPLTTAIRYIGVLEMEGVIERVPDPHDSRRSLIQLTNEGRRRLEAIASRWKLRLALALSAIPVAVLATITAASYIPI